jgi:hypothetical protein
VLAVLGRIRVWGRWDRVLAPDLAVPALGDALTTADVAEDLARSAIRIALGIEMRARTISVRLTHVPAALRIRRHDSLFGLPGHKIKGSACPDQERFVRRLSWLTAVSDLGAGGSNSEQPCERAAAAREIQAHGRRISQTAARCPFGAVRFAGDAGGHRPPGRDMRPRDWLLLLLALRQAEEPLDPVRLQKGMFLLAQEGGLPPSDRYEFFPSIRVLPL